MNEPTDAASLRDERQVHGDLGTASPAFGDAEGARARARLLSDVLGPIAESMGIELVHAEWAQAGRRRKLQIFIDKDGGIDLSDCARMSPIFGNALDAAEAAEPSGPLAALLASAYVLEVSSPGLDRPLARLSHFQRYVGSKAKVRTLAPLAADSTQRNFRGRITAATPDASHPDDDTLGLVVLHDEDSGVDHQIPVAYIRRAHLVYEGDAVAREV